MQDNEKRINAGYEIIDSFPVGKVEMVLGQSTSTPTMYVTWEYCEAKGYYWGHYFSDKDEAKRDMYDRAAAEISFQKSIKTKEKPEPKDKKKDDREDR